MTVIKSTFQILTLLSILIVAGCMSNIPRSKSPQVSQSQPQIAQSITANEFLPVNSRGTGNYQLGGGDLLSVKVLGASELDRKFRLSTDGTVSYPLIGDLQLGGLSLMQAERLIAQKLSLNYLQNPQVSIFIEEYSSNQVSVTGEVSKPNVYNLTQPRTVVEILALAGGLTAKAGEMVRIQTRQLNPSTGETSNLVFVVNINELLSGQSDLSKLYLASGDALYVPEAGVVYVEGAVNKPGAYALKGEITLRKAMVLAGGAKWSANKSQIGILRQGNPDPILINYQEAVQDSSKDLIVYGGDVVIVDYSIPKRSIEGFYNFLSRIINVGVGYRLD